MAICMAVDRSGEGGKEGIVFTSAFFNVKEDAENGVFIGATSLIGKGVDEVHLKIELFSINGVLWRGVEMELKGVVISGGFSGKLEGQGRIGSDGIAERDLLALVVRLEASIYADVWVVWGGKSNAALGGGRQQVDGRLLETSSTKGVLVVVDLVPVVAVGVVLEVTFAT